MVVPVLVAGISVTEQIGIEWLCRDDRSVMHGLEELLFPGSSIGRGKVSVVVDCGGEFDLTTRTGIEPESCVNVAIARNDEHDGPV